MSFRSRNLVAPPTPREVEMPTITDHKPSDIDSSGEADSEEFAREQAIKQIQRKRGFRIEAAMSALGMCVLVAIKPFRSTTTPAAGRLTDSVRVLGSTTCGTSGSSTRSRDGCSSWLGAAGSSTCASRFRSARSSAKYRVGQAQTEWHPRGRPARPVRGAPR